MPWPMLDEFRKNIAERRLLAPKQKVLVAVSGGLDSVVLCNLLHETGIPFVMAHCNFGLRGKESDGDEKFVKRLAELYQVPCHSIRLDAAENAAQSGISIQEAARNLRYAWFEKVRKNLRCHHILTAHHLDDSMETFFIHLLRSTGVDGLRGIPEKNGNIIRPLLFAARSDIERYAKAKKLRWREDSSNAGDDYTRNLYRHRLLPLLRSLQPSLGKIMDGNMQRLGEAADIVRLWSDEALGKAVTKTGRDAWRISMEALPAAWRSFLLYQFLKDKGFDRWQADAMTVPSRRRAAGQLFMSDRYEALKDRTNILVRRLKSHPARTTVITGRNSILRLPAGNWQVRHRQARGLVIPKQETTAALDATLLQFPLAVRRWQAGDSFRPLGMKGSKKVSDFLADKKISRFEKENIFVILSGSEVVCLLGFRIDDRYKITSGTRRVLLLEPRHD